MKFEIKNRWSGAVIFSLETETFKLCVEAAIKSSANLSDADLSAADLRRANLRRANLSDANLSAADLRCANLSDANLSDADLSDANLSDANLRCANLRRANLSDADLSDANLSAADLRCANLSDANLRRANLSDADLSDAKLTDLQSARLLILPDGDIIGWKQCRNNVIVKLKIPADSKRSNSTGRKCRCEFADVLEVIGADVGLSRIPSGGEIIEYRKGQRVKCVQDFDPNRWVECSHGIHFYISKIEAEHD